MELFGFLIIIVVIIFIIWFLPKAVKGWKVSWVGVIIAFILAAITKGENMTFWFLIFLMVIYYVIAVVIFKAIKEIRDFFSKKK